MTKKRSEQPNAELCQFPFSDGRLCRMLRHPRHPNLCPFHAHAELQLLEARSLGAEIATTLTGHFISSADVVHILGKVFAALAQDRIPQKKAATLGYLGQIMLHAMPNVARETDLGFSGDTWMRLVNHSVYPEGSRVRKPTTITSGEDAASPPPTPASANPTTSRPPVAPKGQSASPPPAAAPTRPSSATSPSNHTTKPEPPAGVTMPPSAHATTPLTPSQSAHPQNPPATPVESALPKIRT